MQAGTSNSVNSDALIERGYNSLVSEEYDRAYECFDRALDIDAKAHTAYWGMLLSERQCMNADGSDLIKVGICIDADQNYRFAYQYADEVVRKEYEKTAMMCEHMCHIILIELICEKRMIPAKLRAKNYAESSFADKRLIDAHHSLLREDAMTEFSRQTPSVLISLLEIYRNNTTFSTYDREFHFSEKLKGLYKEYMDRLLRKVALEREFSDFGKKKQKKNPELVGFGPNNSGNSVYSLPNIDYDGSFYTDMDYYHECQRKAAEQFIKRESKQNDIDCASRGTLTGEIPKRQSTEQDNYAELWVKPYDRESEFIGADGKPSAIGERWRYLAKYLPTTKGAEKTDEYAAMILDFYDRAIENGSDPKVCIREKQTYFDQIITEMNSYLGIEWLSLRAPDSSSAYYRLLDMAIKDQEKTFINMKEPAEKRYKEADRLVTERTRVLKKDAEWLKGNIIRNAEKLEKDVVCFRNTLKANRETTDKYFSKLLDSNNEEYIKLTKESKHVQALFISEIDKYEQLIQKLHEYVTKLSQSKGKLFSRYIEMK